MVNVEFFGVVLDLSILLLMLMKVNLAHVKIVKLCDMILINWSRVVWLLVLPWELEQVENGEFPSNFNKFLCPILHIFKIVHSCELCLCF